VKARNTSSTSENKIHDDEIARRFGFRGALVPGVTVYAYLTHPLAEAFGAAWLERGTASVRFTKPIHEGEEVRVTGTVTARDPKSIAATGSTSQPAMIFRRRSISSKRSEANRSMSGAAR